MTVTSTATFTVANIFSSLHSSGTLARLMQSDCSSCDKQIVPTVVDTPSDRKIGHVHIAIRHLV